jgi:tetratricopeptide (TPR) repeat protein
MLADGLHTGYGERSDHWPLARLLLEGVQPSPADDPLVRQFYLATSLYLANGLRFDELKPQLRSALQIFPNDPGLHLVAGAMHEFLAMPATQAGVRDGLQARGVRVDVETERAELALAVSHLRQATEVAPAFGEARLHFGRVLGLQGRHGDAADQLRRARPSLDVPMLAFYGEMFLGREEQALGRMDIAREHFERAASLFSRAQSPRLSLSQLAALRGDRAAAVAALGDTLTSVGADAGATDPWWVYNVSHTRDLTAELARLHRMVPRAVQK